jgi:hypothetical protein
MITYSNKRGELTMKAYDYYTNNPVPYPSKKAFKRYNVFDRDTVLGLGLAQDELSKIVLEHPNATVSSYSLDEEYKEQLKAYRDGEHILLEEFKADLFEEFGVTGNPKADKAYHIAWEHGHSSGLSEIYSFFSDLVELIQ